MPKFRVMMKNPDAVGFEFDEYLQVEVDTDAGTCIVVESQ